MKSSAARLSARLAAITSIVAATASCGIEKQQAPALAGPSEFARSITMVADPSIVARDGVSQARITVLVRDVNAAPVAQLPINLTLNPVNGGTLSASQVVTDAAGQAVVMFTAPAIEMNVTAVTIVATPFGGDFNSSTNRTISVGLLAPAAATPAFNVSPASPQRFQTATFDATPTTFGGQACGAACTYNWSFGSENTATGQIVTYQFQQQATYVVTLDVTSPGGVITRTQQNVVVQAGTLPTATFTISPSNPRVGDTVFFNAGSSTAANGATITDYTWDFGGGQAIATGVSVSTTYGSARTYVVRLTVRDSNGQTATITANVIVAAP